MMQSFSIDPSQIATHFHTYEVSARTFSAKCSAPSGEAHKLPSGVTCSRQHMGLGTGFLGSMHSTISSMRSCGPSYTERYADVGIMILTWKAFALSGFVVHSQA